MSTNRHHVYILKCCDDTYYTGYATDVERRVKEHNGDVGKAAARYTRGRTPVTLVYTESFQTRSDALKREAAIKKLTRVEKETLIKRNTQIPLTKTKK